MTTPKEFPRKLEVPLPQFVETVVDEGDPARCVDGRPDPNSLQGPQMPGGSIFPVLIDAVVNNMTMNNYQVITGLGLLRSSDFPVGVHRDDHHHEGISSGCGFADQMPAIVALAVDQRADIINRMQTVYETNRAFFESQAIDLPTIIQEAYAVLKQYDPNKIKVVGEQLVAMGEKQGSAETVTGDHGESIAFINFKKGITLDTKTFNQQGHQGFNLDLWAAVEQSAKTFGVKRDLAAGLSLILYQATEMQLVEKKGKAALPVVLHS